MSIPNRNGLESVQGAATRWFPVSWQQALAQAFSGFAVPVSEPREYADPTPQCPPPFFQDPLEQVVGDQPEEEHFGPQQSINAFQMSPYAEEFNSIPLQDTFLDGQSYEEEKTNKWNLDAPEFIPRGVHAQQDRKFCLNPNASEFKPRDITGNPGQRDQQVSTDHSTGTATISEASNVDKICELSPNARDLIPKCPHVTSVPLMIQAKPEAKDEPPAPVKVCQQAVHKHEEEEQESVAPSQEVVEAKKRLIKLVRAHQQKCPQSIEVFCRDIHNSTCNNHTFMEEYTSVYESLINLFGQEVDNKMDKSDRRKHFGVIQPKLDKLSMGSITANRAELDHGTGTIKVHELTKQGEVVQVEPILAFVSSTGQNSHCVNCFKQVASVAVQCCRAIFCSEVCSTEAIKNGRHNAVTGGLFPELGKNAHLVYQLVAVAGLDQTRAIIRSNLAEAVTNSVESVLLLEAIHLKVVLERTLSGGTEHDQYHIAQLYSMLAALKCNPLCCDPLEEWQARVQSVPAKSLQSTQVRCGYVLTEFSSAPGPMTFSCSPNTFRRLNHAQGVIEYVARRALHPGEQLTLTWGLNEKRFPVGEKRRKVEITTRFNVVCQCVKCDPDWRKD